MLQSLYEELPELFEISVSDEDVEYLVNKLAIESVEE